jgi:DNA-binding MarR family transcriptional regulator
MVPAGDARRALANALGALALVITDELRRVVTAEVPSATDAAALSALAQFLDGATIDRVHSVLGLTPSGAVRLVDRLSAEGLAARGPGPDRRTRAVRLTSRGRERAAAVGAARSSYLAGILDTLDDDSVESLRTLVAQVMAAVVAAKDGGAWTCRLCDLNACRRSEGECPAYNAALARAD